MKLIIINTFIALLIVAVFAHSDSDTEIVHQSSDVQPDSYNFAVETSDGKSHVESGKLKDIGGGQKAMVVHGSFSWIAPDGQKYTVNYVADENGFQPEGAHLPVVPKVGGAPTRPSNKLPHH